MEKMNYKSYADDCKKAIGNCTLLSLIAIGEVVRKKAYLRCPYITSRLRNSIDYETIESEKKVAVGTNVEYAIPVEVGSSRQKAQPFLESGAMDSQADIKKITSGIFSKLGGSK
jgi:HK97 gp10 family phage protein